MIRLSRYRHFFLLLLALSTLWWLPTGKAQATVTCTTTMTSINFGTVDPTQNAVTNASGNLSFTCQNDTNGQDVYVTACLNIGTGNGTTTTPRTMSNGSSNLDFQLYQDASLSQIWGSILTPATPSPKSINFIVPKHNQGGLFTSQIYPVYGALSGPQIAGAGTYSNNFSGADAFLTMATNSGGPYPASCGGSTSGSPYPFTVNAQVSGTCTVTAGPTLNLGDPAGVDADATAISITGSNIINVTCTNGTPYYVGLAPSNGSTTGAGLMTGTGSNTDKIPYQLRSTAGIAGSIWGNTSTSTSVGNGVAGNGNGNSQSLTVYATALRADFTPDTYTDIVTINVNY